MAVAQGQTSGRQVGVPALALLALAAALPWRSAHAYIDPNTAGPLYQFLFPLLVAAASALTALRRYIARLWNRLAGAVVTALRGQRARPEDP